MGTVTLPHLTKADTDDNLFSEVKANDQAIIDQVNGSLSADNLATNAVTTAKILDANVTDAKLASPNNSVYRTLVTGGAMAEGKTVAASPYYLTSVGTVQSQSSALQAGAVPLLWPYTSGDYTVGSLTTKFRVRMEVLVAGTSPSTVTLTAGLYPVTISAGNVTLGTVVTGSTALSSGLAINTISPFNSGDFAASALLSDPGRYVLGFAVGSITVPAFIGVVLSLQTRNV